MSAALRVFISSTMLDLANERAAVVDLLRAYNFEPVNAETVVPTGNNSWSTLEAEIASCEAFVLILGDRYGWIPTDGPHASEGLSVTELEYRAARTRELPIFVFCKTLPYGTSTETADARARDRFRKEISDWGEGYFRAEFALAKDLAPQVTRSLMSYLFDKARSRTGAGAPPRPVGRHTDAGPIAVPTELVSAVRERTAILWAGAGMSLQSGLPSAAMFTEALLARIQEHDPSYVRGAHGGDFNSIASDLELLVGADAVRAAVTDLMVLDRTTPPSTSQSIAARNFDLILTTNYDTLLERADRSTALTVIDTDTPEQLPANALVKLHGSLDNLSWLVLTDKDLRDHAHRRRHLLRTLITEMRHRPVIVVGSTLRDPSTVALFDSCKPNSSGWLIGPAFNMVERMRAANWNLQPVVGTAEKFFVALQEALDGYPT